MFMSSSNLMMRGNRKENQEGNEDENDCEYFKHLPTMLMIKEHGEKEGNESGKEVDDDGNDECGSYENESHENQENYVKQIPRGGWSGFGMV